MKNIEGVEARLGIPLRDRSVSGPKVKKLLLDQGVEIRGKDTISQIRGGHTTGAGIDRALVMTEALKGTAAQKDELYHSIARSGTELRHVRERNRYVGGGLTEEIGEELGIQTQDVRRSMRGMRADLVMAEQSGKLGDIAELFKQVAREYITAYSYGRDYSPAIRDFGRYWEIDTIENFYRLFYEMIKRSQTATTWNPFEMDVMREYYAQREKEGSQLSEFDKLTLERNRNRSALKPFVERIGLTTGIPYDGVVHFAHTNALLYGQPTNPESVNRNGNLINGKPFLLMGEDQPAGHTE